LQAFCSADVVEIGDEDEGGTCDSGADEIVADGTGE